MKFGILLSAQHLSGEDIALRAGEHAAQVRAMEELGFDSVWIGQHFLSDYQELQPVPTLSWLSAQTERLLIGTGILLLPLYHPLILAEELATLDVLCRGRLIAGFGLGYRDREFEAFGLARSEAGDRLSEGIDVIKRLWTQASVDFEGRFYRLRAASIQPKPLQRPRPEIWLAANSDRAIRRAAAIADAWLINPHATISTLRRQVNLYREEVAKSRKTVDGLEIPLMREVYVAPTIKQAQAEAFPILMNKYERYVTWGQDVAMKGIDRLDLPINELTHDRFIVGDPDYCAEEVHRYRELLGVTHLILRIQWPGLPPTLAMRSMRLFGERILPSFK